MRENVNKKILNGIPVYSTVTGGELIDILKNVSNPCRSVAFALLLVKNPLLN
jgi:hypothetical protein